MLKARFRKYTAELLKYEKKVLKLNLEDNNNNNSVGS
jgi:hypothetical protein